MKRLHAFFLVGAMFLTSYAAAAPLAAPNALGTLVEEHTAAGKQTVTIGGIDFNNKGRPLDSRGVPTIETDGSASAKTTGTGNIKNPSGNPVRVTLTGRVAPAAAAAAIGRFAAKIAYPLTVGMALYQLAKELGFTVSNNPDGSVKYEKENPALCTVAPCYNYQYHAAISSIVSPVALTACQDLIAKYDRAGSYRYSNASVDNFPPYGCYAKIINPNGTLNSERAGMANATLTTRNPDAPGTIPSERQEFIDAIAAKSGWPATSALSQALEDAAKATGEKVKPETLTLSGPATSPGTSSQTQKSDGSTETRTTTHNHTYNGNNVTTTNTTVVNNYNPTTNITTTETTTETPPKEDEEPDYEATDTPLPEQPKLYTPKYPGGLAKVWADRKSDFMSSPLLQLTSALTPNIPAAGCPQFSVNLDLAVVNFGSYNVGPPCYVWDFCKVVILVSALFLARALIFGG